MTPGPRTLAYLTSFYARAGDTFIRREVEELRRRGWTVHTFSIRRPDEQHVAEDVAREQRGTVYVLERGPWPLLAALARAAIRSPRRLLRALRDVRAVRAPGLRSAALHAVYLLEAAFLAEEITRRGVALIHDHIAMSSATVAMLASTLSGVPFTMTVHGLELHSAAECGLGRKIAAAAATVCISEHGRGQCMLFSDPEHWSRLQVVRCGLDARFLDAPERPPADAPRLVCVGRLSPEKGQVLLVDAAARLKQRGVAAEIVLIGDGPSRPEIERRARALGVEAMLRLVGWQSSDEVLGWISRSRGMVLPSLTEGIPVALMEAMALRKPVVATRVGGVPELVQPGESGWLVSAGSPDELAEAMAELLACPRERLDGMGERGRATVLARHDGAAEVGKLDALFGSILANSVAAPAAKGIPAS